MEFVPSWLFRRYVLTITHRTCLYVGTEYAILKVEGGFWTHIPLVCSAVWARNCTDHLQCSQHLCGLHLGRYCHLPSLPVSRSFGAILREASAYSEAKASIAAQLSSSTRTSRVFPWPLWVSYLLSHHPQLSLIESQGLSHPAQEHAWQGCRPTSHGTPGGPWSK